MLSKLSDKLKKVLNGDGGRPSPMAGEAPNILLGTRLAELALKASDSDTIADLDTSTTFDFGEDFAGGRAIAVISAKSGSSASAYVETCSDADADGIVTVTLDAAPGSSETTTVTCFIDASDNA